VDRDLTAMHLQRHVPRWLARRLVERGGPPSHPVSQKFTGAALFADITGFTALTEQLARRGPDGAERLTELLNDAFGGMIRGIVDSGGDVLSFAGDALLAVWTQDDALARSLVAADACHRCLADGTLGSEGLQVRVGIGAGPLSLHELGSGERWVSVGSGPALHAMATAERAAQPGDTMVWSEGIDALPAGVEGIEVDGGLRISGRPEQRLSPTPESPLQWSDGAAIGLRAFLPAAVLSRVDAGQTAWMAELRTVTPIFVLLRGCDPANAEQAPMIQRVLAVALDGLDVFEGTLDKILVDDRGTSIVAAFGYPPRAHEDDATRAVRTALLIEDACRAEGISFGIGLATGRVFCGPYGSTQRREYTMLGDSVNLAARLMAASQNATWCDTSTAQSALGRVRFEELEAVRVKGKEAAVVVHRPLDERDLTGRHEVLLTGRHEALLTGQNDALRTGALGALTSLTLESVTGAAETLMGGELGGLRMVGREDERDALSARLDRLVLEGRGGVVVIEGDAGMGKSLLGAWLHEEALSRGVTPLLGAADAATRADAYRVWRDVFVQMLELQIVDDLAAARERVTDLLGTNPELVPWAPLLEPVLRVGFEPSEITEAMPGAAAADALKRLLLHLLEHGARDTPRLVLLDDVQWMGPSSWALAASVAERLDGVLLVLFSRPMVGAPPPERAQIAGLDSSLEVALGGLSNADLEELACRRLGVDSLPEAVASAVLSRADGNPFFAEELVWALVDSGQVRVENGVCVLGGDGTLRSLSLPDTLQGVVTARLDRLDPGDALTAKIAAVFGREFEWRVLKAVYPRDSGAEDLRQHLDRLVRDEILTLEGTGVNPVWSFRHLVIQESAYGLLPFTRRRPLHRAIAQWHEAQHEDLSPHYPLLAHHWRRAHEFERALECLDDAAFIANQRGACREALQLLDTAFEVADESGREGTAIEPDRLHDWTGRKGQVWQSLGEFIQAQEALSEAILNLGVSIPTTTAGWVVRTLWEVMIQARNVLLPTLRPKYRNDVERERLLAASRHTSTYGNTCYFTVEPLKWFTMSLVGVNLGERARDDRPASEGFSNLGNIAGTLRLERLATSYFARARTTEDLSTRIVADWAEGVVDLTLCRWQRFQTVIDSGVEQSRRIGDRTNVELGLTIRGIGQWLTGPPAPALAAFGEGLDSARERGNIEHWSWSLTFSAPALLAVGDLARLRRNLSEAREILDRMDPFTRVVYEGVRAQLLSRDGEHDEALVAAAEAVTRFKEPLTMYTYLPAFGGAAEAVFEAIDAERNGVAVASPEGFTLPKLAARTVKCLKTHAGTFEYFKPRASMAEGTLLWLKGREAKARAKWTQAAEAAESLGLPYERALVELERARWMDGADAESAANAAAALLRELQAHGDLARLDSAAGRGNDALGASA
jgi:class 3 adenylate cyclase/tetratricopeptide (TPR) repeat protein